MPVIFQDNFNDVPGTDIKVHTPDIGLGWIHQFTAPKEGADNSLEISSSGDECEPVNVDTDSRFSMTMSDVVLTNEYQVKAVIRQVTGDADAAFWLVARWQDQQDFYGAGGYPSSGGLDQTRGLVMFVIRFGLLSVLATAPEVGLTDGDELRFVCTDEAKELWLNGNLVLRSNDNSFRFIGPAGLSYGNWLATQDDVRDDTRVTFFEVDTTIELEPVKPEIPFIRISTGQDSQIQLFKWEGLNETNRGAVLVSPRLTRKSIQVVGIFGGGLIRMEGSLIPIDSPDSFAGQFVAMEDQLGLRVSLLFNGVIDRINHAFAYRPVVVSGSGADLTLFLLSVSGGD